MTEAGGKEPPAARERICAALIEVVSERGYQSTTLDEVIDRAEVSHAEFARQFESLDVCFEAVWEEVDTALHRRMAIVCADEDNWQDRLRDALHRGLEYLEKNEGRARIYFAEVIYVNDVLRERQRAALNQLGVAVDRGRLARPGSDQAPSHIVDAIVGAMWYQIHHLVRVGKIAALTDQVPLLMYFAVMPYLGREAAEAELQRPRSR